MSLVVGVATSSKNMGFDENKESESETNENQTDSEIEAETGTEDEDDDDTESKIQLGPQCTLKELSEKDKDDESLMRWKEQLFGSVDINDVGETLNPEVKILRLAIKTAGRNDIVLPILEDGNPKSPWFTLKEWSKYNLVFTFQVSNNIVSGLKYNNNVWKTGIKVDNTKEMIGTFSPQVETYTHEMPEETTPAGIFSRGTYTAKTQSLLLFEKYLKRRLVSIGPPIYEPDNESELQHALFLDDDKRCYLELNYTFEIKKDWHQT